MSGSNDREILNIEEAAALLGVSIKTFNKVLHTQHLPARKIGREWKFSRQALIDWVGSGSSVDFYRETSDSQTPQAGPARSSKRSSGSASGAKSQRTVGWKIEVD